MRKVCLFLWCVLPIAWACYYYGPGQEHLKRDNAAEFMQEARVQGKEGNWEKARELYDQALKVLPKENSDNERVTLRLAKLRTFLNSSAAVKATEEAEALMMDVQTGKLNVSDQYKNDIRASLAHSEYYTAWHMRLEGSPRVKWMKELETSRQNFRVLAEQQGSENLKKNLEASILLARMDLNKLKTIPLPDEDSGKGSSGC